MPEFVDTPLTCRDCHQSFTYVARLQEIYAERGYTQPPTRCPTCHEKRKVNSGQGNEIHCSVCGKADTVNFVPSGRRPILCGACFRGQGRPKAAVPAARKTSNSPSVLDSGDEDIPF